METKNINGQPQISPTFGNRMVTYDGLVDFLEMLKKEIPKMGDNNTIGAGTVYSYTFERSNEGSGNYGFSIGRQNTRLTPYGYIFGEDNSMQSKANHNVIMGSNNHSYRPYGLIFGANNTVGSNTTNSGSDINFICGKENEITGDAAEDSSNINCIYGKNNEIYQGSSICIFGNENHCGQTTNVYVLGQTNNISQNRNFYALGNFGIFDTHNSNFPTYYFGQYNATPTGYQTKDIAIIIGAGADDKNRRNLLELDYQGHIKMPGGCYFDSEVTFNSTLTNPGGATFRDVTIGGDLQCTRDAAFVNVETEALYWRASSSLAMRGVQLLHGTVDGQGQLSSQDEAGIAHNEALEIGCGLVVFRISGTLSNQRGVFKNLFLVTEPIMVTPFFQKTTLVLDAESKGWWEIQLEYTNNDLQLTVKVNALGADVIDGNPYYTEEWKCEYYFLPCYANT